MERMRVLRKKKGLSGGQLGAIVGVQKSAISKYERGEIQPSHEVLIKIADCLDTTVDYLLGRSDDPRDIKKPDIEVWNKELGRYVPVETKANSTKKEPLSLEEIEALYMQALIDKKIMTPGKPMSPETRQKLEEQIRLAIRIAIESNKGD